MIPHPPRPTLFPYTTLFRSGIDDTRAQPLAQAARALIELLVAAHAVDPALHRVLAEQVPRTGGLGRLADFEDRKSTRLNSSHLGISYAVFCLKKKNPHKTNH